MALSRLQNFDRWRQTQAIGPEPPENVDVETISSIVAKVLARDETHLTDRESRELLFALGIELQDVPAVGLVGRGCTLTLFIDPQFGSVCGFGVADPMAAVLNDVVYRLAPMHVHHTLDAVESVRAFPLVGGDILAKSYAEVLHRLSWLHELAPEIALVSLADLRYIGDQRTASVSITVQANPQVFDPRVRRMAG